ncbi:MAG: caspase family protein [Pseudomonadota bacterium]
MKSAIMRLPLITMLLCTLFPSSICGATERRTALVIGNSHYSDGLLKNPVNDATDIAAALKGLGFTVTLRLDADLRVMKDEIDNFGETLKKGGVGLFFYAGHGIQVGGVNYLIPVRAKISNERMVEYEALDVNRLLSSLDYAGNSLNIVMLDACRDNPLARSFRSAGRGLAIISRTPQSTIISFSTGANQVAADGDGRNSPYTAAFLQSIKTPGLPVEQVFKSVRNKLVEDTQGRQEPAEYTTLRGDFYFVPHRGETENSPDTASTLPKSSPEPAPDDLSRQQALDGGGETLSAERRKTEAERQALAMGQRLSAPAAGETGRDGHFIAYDNGTVLDTKTSLMWASKDNGSNISWANARSYCENYRGGGYSDWRMPTQDELAGLYDAGKPRPAACSIWYPVHVATELIDITCYVAWASESRGSEAAVFNFGLGNRYWLHQSDDISESRALPVRSGR